MHEWALAEAVILSALETAKKKGLKRIKEIGVILGEMQNIDRTIFRTALNELALTHGKMFEGFRVNIKKKKTVFRCRSCGKEWEFSFGKNLGENEKEAIHFIPEVSHAYVKCPGCGSRDFEIIKGRGVWIKYIRGKG